MTASARAFEREQSELLQLLYLCPVAIARINGAGTILLMNPYGAQLLMLISRDGTLSNFFDLFDPFAPEVAEMARRFNGRAGKVCEEHHVALPPRSAKGASTIVSLTLQKVDTDTFVAVLADVTSAAGRELFVRLSEERLHAVIDGLSQYSICTVDTEGLITSWNRTAERLDNYRSDEIIGRHIDMLLSGSGGGLKSSMGKRLELARRNGSHQFEAWRVRKDGRQYWASISISVLHDKDDSPLGYSVIAHDLAEQRLSEDRLRILATTDPLTGALNRRAFFDDARVQRTSAAEFSEAVSVLLIDADHLKKVNAEHGFEAGDVALRQIVKDCLKEIRSQDILGRFGGEEFAIFLPGCDALAAQDTAERIRARIADSRDFHHIGCTVSIGVASSAEPSDTVEDLLRWADTATYCAKIDGRNRVAVADSSNGDVAG